MANIVQKIVAEEKFKLSRPLRIEPQVGDGSEPIEITELSLPFSILRGRYIVEAQEEFEALVGAVDVPDVDKRFHAYLIAKMAKVPYDAILDDLVVHDFTTLTLTVYRFLLRGVAVETPAG